jgi:osmotically-inducible protein OsmY
MKRRIAVMLVGGVLGAGLPLSAVAQPSPYTATNRPAERSPGRAAEIAAEVAWSADPVTFPYRLKAKAVGEGLELTGYVPSALIQARVAALAQSASGMAVVNRLVVQPNMEMPPPATPDAAFASEVRGRLEQAAMGQVNRIEVRLAPNGVVTLSGNVNTAEDRLRYSQCLRGLPGCAAVKNDLVARDAASATAANRSEGRPEGRTLPALTVDAPRHTPPPSAPAQPELLPLPAAAPQPTVPDTAASGPPPLAATGHIVGTVKNPVVPQTMVPTVPGPLPSKPAAETAVRSSLIPRPLFRDKQPSSLPPLLPPATRDAGRPALIIFDDDPPSPKAPAAPNAAPKPLTK